MNQQQAIQIVAFIRNEGFVKPHMGVVDIVNDSRVGLSVMVKHDNNKQPFGYFEDLEALEDQMAVAFLRRINTIVEAVKEEFNLDVTVFGIYISARQLEFSMY